MGIGDQLSVEYEEYKRRSRTSAPFIYEEDGTVTLYFEMGSVQSQMHVSEPHLFMLGYTRAMMGFLLFNKSWSSTCLTLVIAPCLHACSRAFRIAWLWLVATMETTRLRSPGKGMRLPLEQVLS